MLKYWSQKEIGKFIDIKEQYVYINNLTKNPKQLFHVKCICCPTEFGVSRPTIDKYIHNKMDTAGIVQKTFFLQIVNDPRFKELVMEKTAMIVSENFASRLIKE